jgi:hypothetical protein
MLAALSRVIVLRRSGIRESHPSPPQSCCNFDQIPEHSVPVDRTDQHDQGP